MLQLVVGLVGLVGLVIFVITSISSFDMINDRVHENEMNVVAASSCTSQQHGLFDPCAGLDTSTVDDLRMQDVLTVDPATAPEALTLGLLQAGAYEADPSGSDALLVPAGTQVDAPGALYVATGEGWLGCEDFVTWDAECNQALLVPVQAS